jgi:serine/threonine-protein kinase
VSEAKPGFSQLGGSRAADDAAPLAREVAAARSDPSRTLGPFLLLSEIGRGAFGSVWRALDQRLGRLVAIKLLLSQGGSAHDDAIARFHREAEAIARLRHPAIAAVHEVGVAGGHPYIAMDYVDGTTLAETLAPEGGTGRISLTEGLAVMREVARAVHHSHEHGVVHRDIKPQNIMIDRQGRPYVLDFGLALLGEQRSRLTRTGSTLGTPAYMSPSRRRAMARASTRAATSGRSARRSTTCSPGGLPSRARAPPR